MNTLTYFFIQIGFAGVTIVFFGLLLRAIRKSIDDQRSKIFRRIVIALLAWMSITGVMALTGFLHNFDVFPPRLMIVLVIPLIVTIVIMNLSATREILSNIPPHVLIRLQVFRVFVEFLLLALFTQNLLPVQMTFEGRNFDILSGLTAPIIAWLYQHKRITKGVVIAWNIACLGLLINIVTVAILSLPSPFRYFMNEPANTIVTEFPIVWLPAMLVPLAYGLHLLSLKQLLLKKEQHVPQFK